MIRCLDKVWVLDTTNTTYVFALTDSGHLEHLYYGDRIDIEEAADVECLRQKQEFAPGNAISYSQENTGFSLENFRLEMSSYGKGDIREPFVEIAHHDGAVTDDFLYDSYSIGDKTALKGLPSSYDEENKARELLINLKDNNYNIDLQLVYSVFEDCDCIVRSARLINRSEEKCRIKRLMSTMVDFDRSDMIFSTFNGAWAREMEKNDRPLMPGKTLNSSITGSSSSRANPFVMLSLPGTGEDLGECYGFNLVYSGNHYECCHADSYGQIRFVSGINPESFEFGLAAGEEFQAPEAVMTYSKAGFNGMSHNMHRFVREHIVRGSWKKKPRPVLLNSWEAAYMNINEGKLLKLAKKAKEAGIELFVMDDGWFGDRNDDTRSLGDWDVNPGKLPNGLKGLCDKIRKLGLDFGIWVEPEMVNVNSNLYRQHQDWTMEIPGKPHSEGRNQRILDFANPQVVEYMTEKMSEVFSSADISYVKWDMNRIFSDYYSPYLDSCSQKETAHRYMLGLYSMMEELTSRFPDILFEGCSAGGNRFDLGILCYFPQIWASDDTDALYRVNGMTGYSYGYPMSVVSAHVSACPNHQTLRRTPLSTRFNVAAFGVLGYECNLCDMKKEELQEIKSQIELYKKWREIFFYGDFYRGRSGNLHEWTCLAPDGSKAVGMLMQELVKANDSQAKFYPKGLQADTRYHFYNLPQKYNIKEFGDLVNTVSPVHIKQDSALLDIVSRFVTMPGETEDYNAKGSLLMSGVSLKQGFPAGGYNEQIRFFPDFASRMYFIEAL